MGFENLECAFGHGQGCDLSVLMQEIRSSCYPDGLSEPASMGIVTDLKPVSSYSLANL